MPHLRHRHTLIGLLVLIIALVGPGGAAGSQVKPPGPTGCKGGLTVSSADPAARLPARGVFRPATRRVRLLVRDATQTTLVTIRAYFLDGRRADAWRPGEYTCTVPRAVNTIAFPVRRLLGGAAIRRHGRVKPRVRFQMVNARGRSTALRRVITVTR